MSAVEVMKTESDLSIMKESKGPSQTSDDTCWQTVCKASDIAPDTGACVLFNGQQVAVFKERKQGQCFALSNFDPIGEANVLSRGIIGSIGDELVIASPLYKQHFSLTTGQCIEDASVSVKTWSVRVFNGEVQLSE